jgi:hypothetical protein
MNRIDKALERLLIGSQGEIFSRIAEVSFEVPINQTKSIGYCHCIKSDANGNLRLKDLVEFIDSKIVEYSIPKKEIEEAFAYQKKTGSPSKTIKLQKKAKALFTDLEKTGEGGETLLYILVQEILKLPQLISKMSLKTSGKLHYQGADGIHVQFDKNNNTLGLYWCESKMYSSMATAMDECLKSLQGYLLDPLSYKSVSERDIQLVTSNISVNVNDPELESLLTRYFDKDDDLSNCVVYKGVCFIGFDSIAYPSDATADITAEIQSAVTSKMQSWYKTLGDKICGFDRLNTKEIHFFLMPFKSVKEFRDYFIEEIK